MRKWVKQWLKYVHWYHTVAVDPGVSLEAFFKAPFVSRSWKATREDPHIVRFGLMWPLYDEVAKKGLDYQVPMLDSHISVNPSHLWEASPVRNFLCSLIAPFST